MRYIDKSNRCAEFDEWLKKRKTLPNWDDWRGKIKQSLRNCLWQEQKGLCVYCQRVILLNSPENSETHCHIEHVRPRKTYSELTFTYCNLVMSCDGYFKIGKESLMRIARESCGHIKDDENNENEYDEEQFLHPFELQDIEDYFEYDADGRIFANHYKNQSEQQKADYMIRILALNHIQLIQMRAETYLAATENESNINELLDENVSQLPAFFSMLKFLLRG